MNALLIALVLSQSVVPVKVVDPTSPSSGVTTTAVTSKRGIDTNVLAAPPVTQGITPWITAPTDYAQTAFGEARVATPYTLLDLINKYGIDARALDTSTSSGGTVAAVMAESAVRLSVPVTSGATAKVRTNVYWRYQAGRGQRVLQTLYLSSAAGGTNQTVRWGYFDDSDGLFWQRAEGVTSFCRRTSTTGVPTDYCSPVTLPSADLTKGSIYEIGFQWLGVGVVRAWWNGTAVATLNFPNTLGAPYMKTADLPLSWEIVNTGITSAASMTVICANVTAQGGQPPPEFGFAAERATALTVSTTNLPVISMRIASTFRTVDNRMVVLPHFADAGNANQPAWVGVYLNATLTGPSWVAADAESGVEYDVTATAVTGGTLMGSCFLSSNADKCTIDLTHIFRDNARVMRRTAFVGTSDVLTVVARRTGTVDALVRATLDWTEVP